MALVEPPGTLHRQPGEPHLGERDLGGVDGSKQERGVDDVGLDPRLFQLPPGRHRLLPAEVRERHVDPAREAILEVPGALPVPEQHQRVAHRLPRILLASSWWR